MCLSRCGFRSVEDQLESQVENLKSLAEELGLDWIASSLLMIIRWNVPRLRPIVRGVDAPVPQKSEQSSESEEPVVFVPSGNDRDTERGHFITNSERIFC